MRCGKDLLGPYRVSVAVTRMHGKTLAEFGNSGVMGIGERGGADMSDCPSADSVAITTAEDQHELLAKRITV
jgi:hypothetical protein